MDIRIGLFIISIDHVLLVYIVYEYIRNSLSSSLVISIRYFVSEFA